MTAPAPRPRLRTALTGWLDERDHLPGADSTALFLNQRGQRLSVRSAHDIVLSTGRSLGRVGSVRAGDIGGSHDG